MGLGEGTLVGESGGVVSGGVAWVVAGGITSHVCYTMWVAGHTPGLVKGFFGRLEKILEENLKLVST